MSTSGEWPGDRPGQGQNAWPGQPVGTPGQPSWMNGAIAAGLAVVVVLAGAIVLVLLTDDGGGSGDDGDETASGGSTTTVDDTDTDTDTETDDGAEPTVEGTSTDLADLEVGHCFHDPTEDVVTRVDVVDCESAHDFEVFYIGDLEDGAWPGPAAVTAQADELCGGDAYVDFVGLAKDDSELDVNHLSPTSESWQQAGDRQVTCVITDPAGPSTGTLAGAEK